MGKVVCIGGLIAAGKTTLIQKLMRHFEENGLNGKFMPEIYSNAVRELVHSNLPAGDAFMLAHRLQMCIDALEISKLYDIVLIERSFIDHIAFINAYEKCGQLNAETASLYRRIINELNPPLPDKFVFLEIEPEVAMQRRKARGSKGEGVFTLDFLTALKASYASIMHTYFDDPILLDWTLFGVDESIPDIASAILPAASTR
jgi:thymidylate kinase